MSIPGKRRLSAILFTDMVGYTDLMARDEQYANSLRKRHSKVLTDLHNKYKGEILQYFGDGTLSIFESALNAVRCATEIQVTLQRDPKVPLRIGIHLGEVVWEEDGLYGHSVNIASRLESMAEPGTILVSSRIQEEVSNHPDIDFVPLGTFELKNVPKPVDILAVRHHDLPKSQFISPDGKGQPIQKSFEIQHTDDGNKLISIAVLPFEDLSPGKDQEYLCDGMSDEIITDLSSLKQMRVIARHSSSQLKGSTLTIPEIAQKLGVEYLLTGSIRKADSNLRITAQLVKASENQQVWADKFRGSTNDIFDLQENISRQIIDSLDLQLSRKEQQNLKSRPIEDPRAYDAYLRARKEIFQLDQESLHRAESLINHAMDLIGPNPLLIATKGQIHMSYVILGIQPDPSHLEIAEECLGELKNVDSDSQYMYLLRGLLRYRQTRIQEAIDDFRKVLQQSPNNRDGLLYLGLMFTLGAKAEIAEEYFRKLIELDPLTAINYIMPAYARASQGDKEGSVHFYTKAYGMEPGNPMLMLMMGLMVGKVQPKEEVMPILEELSRMAPYHFFGKVGRFLLLAYQGETQKAIEAGADPQLQEQARWDEHPAHWMAGTYAYLNEKEKALDWLEISINLGNFNYPLLFLHDPYLANLKGEARFHELEKKVKEKCATFRD